MNEYISREAMLKNLTSDLEHHSDEGDPRTCLVMRRFIKYVEDFPAADVQPIYYAENVQNEVLNYLFNKEREAESMSYGDKRQERIATIREIIRFVEDIDPRMDGDTDA